MTLLVPDAVVCMSTAFTLLWVVKLNVDGSSIGNPGPSGFGGLIRNSNGEWLFGFYGSCGFTTNVNAELHAIDHGLRSTWDAGYKDIICESASLLALQLIEGDVPSTHPHAPLISHIKEYRNQSWKLAFTHILREGNTGADWLAKRGANSDVVWVQL